MKRPAVLVLCALVLAFLAAEIGLRLSGVVNLPIYRADRDYGYIPIADQHGAWRNKNRWMHNGLSMQTAEPFRDGGVLLIGDSIVNGGNQTDQPQRLGPQLSAQIDQTVWPISAGSWGLLNELAWLHDNPDVVRRVDGFVFILNGGDFGDPSIWRSNDPNYPAHKPISDVYFVLDRQILAKFRKLSPTPVTDRDWRREFSAFRRTTNKPILVVLYSGRPDFHDDIEKYAPDFSEDALIVKADPRWKRASFRDQGHVDAAGTALLSEIVADRLEHAP